MVEGIRFQVVYELVPRQNITRRSLCPALWENVHGLLDGNIDGFSHQNVIHGVFFRNWDTNNNPALQIDGVVGS